METESAKSAVSSTKVKRRHFCVFCGAPGSLSAEHVFPRWIVQHINPTITATKNGRYGHNILDKDGVKRAGKLSRPGDWKSISLRILCQKCNNGWLSKIQQDASLVIPPFLRGKFAALSDHNILIINRWIMNLAMVCDFTDSDVGTIPEFHRKIFIRRKVVPPDWLIFIGRFGRPELAPHFNKWHGVGAIADKSDVYAHPFATFTFTIGSLIAHAALLPQRLISRPLTPERFAKRFNLVVTHPGNIMPFMTPPAAVDFPDSLEISIHLPRVLNLPFEIPV